MSNMYKLLLPDVGEGVTEAEVVAWHVSVGDTLEEDQSIVDIMTDKVTVDMPSPVCGTLAAIYAEVGEVVAVGSVIAEIAVDADFVAEVTPADKANKSHQQEVQQDIQPISSAPQKVAEKSITASTAKLAAPSKALAGAPTPVISRGEGHTPLAAPATRRRAYELGVALQFVPGTGPGGRITAQDLDNYLQRAHSDTPVGLGTHSGAQFVPRTGVQETPIIGFRRKIAERMADAKSRIPHFSYVEAFDLTELESLRKQLNSERKENQPKLTLLPFFMRAIALLQPDFTHINARYDDQANILHSYDGVHIGIATQTNDGLLVPVVRHVEAMTLWGCATELSRITLAARERACSVEELSGSTITLTNLGALGGIAATPVINSPEVAIIGPNKLEQRAVVQDGQIVIRLMMNLSSSFDHRIVDGYDAAQFVQRIKRLIESPARLFVEQFK